MASLASCGHFKSAFDEHTQCSRCRSCCKYTPAGDLVVCEICEKWDADKWDKFWKRRTYKSRAYTKNKSPRVVLSPIALNSAPRTAPTAKSVSRAGSVRSGPIQSLASKTSVRAASSYDSLASEASGPSFRPSLSKSNSGKVISKPTKSSSSAGSSGDAAQAPVRQSDCVDSASEQVGVLGARPRSGLNTGPKSSKSSAGHGSQAAGPQVQLSGLKRLASPPASPSGERASGQLPIRQSLVSVPTPVLRQDPVEQVSSPVGRGGHEVASSLQMYRPSSSPVRQSRPLSLPVNGNAR